MVETLAEAVLAGERLALARLLTQIENYTPQGRAALDELFPHTGRAHLIGVTGSPGAGKSSLVNQLARAYRHPTDGSTPRKVAIVAVDPSSPFTGGAVLGDRVRMRDLSGDPGVFIRSMASRGALGGLARATAAVAQGLDAAGFEIILIETVGAGQSEVDIARLAHTTLVVEAPGMGDDIQAIKAGILEIADVLVINKADHPGVENTERALRGMLEMSHNHADEQCWVPPVLRCIATQGEGVPAVLDAVNRHWTFLKESGEWERRERARLKNELDVLLQATLVARWRSQTTESEYDRMLQLMCERQVSPNQAVSSLLDLESPRLAVQAWAD